jgi:DNA polymerase-3 subunit alpha
MRKWLRYLQPTTFDDLVTLDALYRPGPMDYIPVFVSRKNGKEKITYDIPCMEKYLKDTYGVTVYQEQIMLLSRLLADFTREESDILRKAMGKRKKDIIDVLKPQFIERGKKNGHNPRILEKIWKDWEHFGCYAFNKSHAVCYTWIAYQTAYLKANYPVEYMAAIMESRKSQKSELNILIKECKRMGLCLVSSDVVDKDNIQIVGDELHLGKKLMK